MTRSIAANASVGTSYVSSGQSCRSAPDAASVIGRERRSTATRAGNVGSNTPCAGVVRWAERAGVGLVGAPGLAGGGALGTCAPSGSSNSASAPCASRDQPSSLMRPNIAPGWDTG